LRELARYKLDLVGVQEVRWEGGDRTCKRTYTFLWKGERVEFVCDRISHITLRGLWCHIIVLNAHAPIEDKTHDVKDSFYEELEHVFDKLAKYHMKIMSMSMKSNETSNDNGVRLVNFDTSKNLTVKCTMFPHCSIHKYTCMSPDGKTHNQIDHILVDRRRHLSVLDGPSFRAADCDTEHYLVVAKVRERLAVNHTDFICRGSISRSKTR
jgi:hypothetical protein